MKAVPVLLCLLARAGLGAAAAPTAPPATAPGPTCAPTFARAEPLDSEDSTHVPTPVEIPATPRPTPRPKTPRPTPEPTPTATRCEDDDDWLYDGKDGRGCAWIAEKTSRCNGKDGAREACPATCGECEPACEDDETWFSKKSSNNCRWVAEKPDSRCSKKSNDKVKAKDACPVACGTCV